MKRIIIAALLCTATQAFAQTPPAPPADKDDATSAKAHVAPAPPVDPAAATDPREKMPDKDKEPKVEKPKDVQM